MCHAHTFGQERSGGGPNPAVCIGCATLHGCPQNTDRQVILTYATDCRPHTQRKFFSQRSRLGLAAQRKYPCERG